MFLVVYAAFSYLQTLIGLSVTWCRNRLLSDQWIPRQVLEFKPSRAKHHAKRNGWFQSDNMGRVITFLDFSPVDSYRFFTVLADRSLFGNHCVFQNRLGANGTVWASDGLPFLHAATLYVVFRILVSLSRCWSWVCFLTRRLTTE
jgi:hypothetical protein